MRTDAEVREGNIKLTGEDCSGANNGTPAGDAAVGDWWDGPSSCLGMYKGVN